MSKKEKEVKEEVVQEEVVDIVEHPSDLPGFDEPLEVDPDAVVEDDDTTDKPINFDPRTLPVGIFYSCSDKEWEKLLPYLIGVDSTRRIRELAQGRNVKPVALLRQGIIVADEQGAFEARGATEKRTAADEDLSSRENAAMISVLSTDCFQRVVKAAKNHRPPCSNKHGLYFAVKRALEASAI